MLWSIMSAFKTQSYLRPPISDQLFLLSINLLTTFLCALYIGKLTFAAQEIPDFFLPRNLHIPRPTSISLACEGGVMQAFFHLCQECRAMPKMNSDRCDGLTDWRKRARLSDTFLYILCFWKYILFLRSANLYVKGRRSWVFTVVCYKLVRTRP